MKRKAVAPLVALISISAAGLLTSQDSDRRRDQWYERGYMTRAPGSPVAAMIERQLRGRGISDPQVLRVMGSVPREKFVPKELRDSAYDDHPLPIGYGQTISQPFIVAFMTEQLQPKKSQRVLEIGTGSGYQAAVLSDLVAEVYTIEIVRPLAQRAEAVLSELGDKNVHVKAGDGYKGWPEHAPFDAIIVTAAPDHVPPPLVEQLKEGGRMVIPVGKSGWQKLYLLEKREGQIRQTAVLPVKFVPLTREPEAGKR
jgi:protein-L-isoaspartate(D-aspartate) O-methyltransferase